MSQRLFAALAVLAWSGWLAQTATGADFASQLPYWAAAVLLAAFACASSLAADRGGATLPPPADGRYVGAAASALAVAITALSLVPRIQWQGTKPWHVSLDEALFVRMGLIALDQRPAHAIHGIDTPAIPYLGEVLQALPVWLGDPIAAIRLGSTAQGLIVIWITYLLARRLFGSTVALAAAAFLGCSYWHMVYSTLGLPMMQPPMAAVAVTYLLVRGDQERNALLLFLAGTALGASLLLYTPARIVVPLVLTWWVHRWWMAPTARRVHAWQLALVVLAAVVFLSPHLAEYGLGVIAKRFTEVFAGNVTPAHHGLADLGWIGRQITRAVRIYVTGPTQVMADGYSSQPLIDPLSLGLILMGVAVAVRRTRETRYFLVWAWMVQVFVLAQMATDLPDSAYRAAPMLPAVAIAVGIAAEWVEQWLPSRRWQLGAAALYVAVALPLNLHSLEVFFREYSLGSRAARMFDLGDRGALYYVLGTRPDLEPTVELAAYGRQVEAVASLADFLARPLPSGRDIVILIEPELRHAVEPIVRCYPGAQLRVEDAHRVGPPGFGLWLSEPTAAAGRDCEHRPKPHGLRARYFDGSGKIIDERVEHWPMRYGHDLDRYRAIEWDGALVITTPGRYQFILVAGDAKASGALGATQLATAALVEVPVSPGVISLRYRCEPARAAASCGLMWLPPGGEVELVPPGVLRPPSASARALANLENDRLQNQLEADQERQHAEHHRAGAGGVAAP